MPRCSELLIASAIGDSIKLSDQYRSFARQMFAHYAGKWALILSAGDFRYRNGGKVDVNWRQPYDWVEKEKENLEHIYSADGLLSQSSDISLEYLDLRGLEQVLCAADLRQYKGFYMSGGNFEMLLAVLIASGLAEEFIIRFTEGCLAVCAESAAGVVLGPEFQEIRRSLPVTFTEQIDEYRHCANFTVPILGSNEPIEKGINLIPLQVVPHSDKTKIDRSRVDLMNGSALIIRGDMPRYTKEIVGANG